MNILSPIDQLSAAFASLMQEWRPPAAKISARQEPERKSVFDGLVKKVNMPSTCFEISEHSLLKQEPDFNHRHLAYCARNPEKGSLFEMDHSSAILKLKNDRELFEYLLKNRFGGIVFSENGQVFSHVFYQRHARVVHAFSLFVSEDKRGFGLGARTMLAFLKHAQQQDGIRGVRLGRGTEPIVKSFIKHLKPVCKSHGVTNVYSNGWLEFS